MGDESHPHPRSLAPHGLWAGLCGKSVANRLARAPCRAWVEAAPRARADPFVLPCCNAPGAVRSLSTRRPQTLAQAALSPPEQPARRPACLIRSSLTSSAKLSQVNPITSNHSSWHVLQFFLFLEVRTESHCLKKTMLGLDDCHQNPKFILTGVLKPRVF